jgi:pimeloyl-ACP methyl ester carboxylesterase
MEEKVSLAITKVGIGATIDSYRPIILNTNRGEIIARFYHIPNIKRAVIFVGGVGGGFDTPARNLYGRLAEKLVAEGISTLWIQYRNSQDLVEATVDVMAGIMFLEQNGIEQIGLVGHSFGSAAVIQAAVNDDNVKTVVCLATQGFGADQVADLASETSLLLIHGKNDKTLPHPVAEYVHTIAHEPKQIMLMEGTGHNLDESSDRVYEAVHLWLTKQLEEGKLVA